MIIAKVFWNTNPDGSWSNNEDLEWNDIPQCWYGPFKTMAEGATWLDGFCPDDTDVYEAYVTEVPNDTKGYINRPEEVGLVV